jgi:hypothetical protein
MKLPEWRDKPTPPREGETMTEREIGRQTLIKLALIDGFLRDFRDESHDQKRVIYERLAEIEMRLANMDIKHDATLERGALNRMRVIYHKLAVVEGLFSMEEIGSAEANKRYLSQLVGQMAAVLREVFDDIDPPSVKEARQKIKDTGIETGWKEREK